MKKILLPLALMSALLVSCEKPVQEHYYIYSEAFELHFTLYGEEQSVYVESSHDWELTDYPDWCIPSIKSGQDGAQVIFTVTENDSDFQREGEIIFSCGDATFSIRVLQDGLNDNIKFNHVKNKLCDEYRVKINGQKVIIDIDRDNDGEISYKEAAEAKYMFLHDGYVEPGNYFPELKYFTALEYLDIGANLTSLDLSNCTALTYLKCRNNQLTSLDLSNNTALVHLECRENQLISLDLSNNTALETLDCDDNQLISLDLSNCTALTSLHCGSNQLTTLDVSNNTVLTDLYCYYNQLTSLDVSNNTALTSLHCGSNQLTTLDVSNNTALTDLYCSSNPLTSLDVSNNRLLGQLSLSDNPLQKLILYKYHIIEEYDMQRIESEYGDIIEYVE